MKWKNPPGIKIYEALGAIGDQRITTDGDTARVYSSSGNKYYDVKYDPESRAIMANDNGSYWVGYLGYPSIAYLMKIGAIDFDPRFSEALKGIKWKDVNTKFKNDFEKTKEYLHKKLQEGGVNLDNFFEEIKSIEEQIKELNLLKLGKRTKPPSGY